MGQRGLPRRDITFMYVAWTLATLAVAGYGLAGAVWQLMLASLAFNALETAGTIVWATAKQRHVPAALLGRVSSLDWLISIGLLPLSFALTVWRARSAWYASGPSSLLGDPGRDEPEQRRALRDRRLDDGLPLLEGRGGGARELMRAVRAHARVAVAHRLLPRVDAPERAAPPGDHLRAVVDDLAVELHLVKDLARPERQVLGPAGVDAAAARLDVRLDPGAGPPFGSGQPKPVKTLVPSGLRNL